MNQWPMVPLANIATPIARTVQVEAGASYRTIGVKWWGEGAYERQTIDGSDTAAKSLSLVREGDLIINKIWVRHGSTAIATQAVDGCAASNEFPTFQLATDRVHHRWIHWLTKTKWFWTQCDLLSMGTSGKNRIKPEKFLTIAIPLPSLPEQRRLVERIDALAAKIEEAKGLRRKAVEETVLLAARSLENLRRRVLEKTKRVVPLCEVTKVTAGGTPSRDNPAFWGGTIPWIKTGELLDGDITTAEEHITDVGVSSSSAKLFPIDTVLIALYGQGQTRGRTGRLLIPSTTNQACAAILPCADLRPRYVQYWLRSLYREMREDNHGGAQPNWNGQMIKDIKIAVPSLEEQENIVRECDATTSNFERLSQHQENVKAELDAILPAILDRAFRGEL